MKTITVLLTTVLFSMSASAALTPACEEYYKEIDNFSKDEGNGNTRSTG